MSEPARAPFDRWPDQVVFQGGRGWLTPHGPAVITQTLAERVDAATAIRLHDFLFTLVKANIGTRVPGVTLLHDWRSVRSVEPSAVQAWLSRSKKTAHAFMQSSIYIACDANPLFRMVLRPALLSNRALTNVPAPELLEDPRPPLARHGIQPPPPDYWAEWLKG